MPPHGQVNLHSHDVGALFTYLTDVLGFAPEFRVRGPDGGVKFAAAWWPKVGQGTRIILGDIEEALHGHYDHGEFGKQMEAHPLGTGVVLYFLAPDVDAVHARIKARGAVIDEPPTDQFWGERTISVIAPGGYYLTFATPIPGFRFPKDFEARIETFPSPARAAAPHARARARVRRPPVRAGVTRKRRKPRRG